MQRLERGLSKILVEHPTTDLACILTQNLTGTIYRISGYGCTCGHGLKHHQTKGFTA